MITNILIVCPYASLSSLSETVARDYPTIHVDTIQGDITNVKTWWNYVNMIQDNYHFVISRGGTMTYLQKHLHVPVLELKTSVFDLMRIVNMIRDYPGKCAIIGSQVVSETSRVICELMHTPIDTFSFPDETTTIEGLKNLKEQGYSLIISGVRGYLAAQSIGMNSILVTSGVEAIMSTFDEALQIHQIIEKTNTENQILREFVHSKNSYHAILDSKGNLVYEDQKFFSVSLELLQKKAEMVFQYGELNTYIQINKSTYYFHGSLINNSSKNNAFIQISACHQLGKENESWISAYSSSSIPHSSYNLLNGSSSKIIDLKEQVNKLACSGNPIIIHGAYGAGEITVLNQLHSLSANSHDDLIIIDVANGNRKLWKVLLEDPDSPLNHPSFNICFQNFNELPAYASSSLQEYLSSLTFSSKKKIYFMWTDANNGSLFENPLMRYLIEERGALSIYTPSLSECRDDLPALTRIALTDCNAHFGKHVFSIENEALELIQDYPWPQNFVQFKQFINNIIMLTDGSTVTAKLVEKALIDITTHQSSALQSPIDLSQTLEEITQNIIEYVLKEEHCNYSRTAKRLGISRTSLWRKLNQ